MQVGNQINGQICDIVTEGLKPGWGSGLNHKFAVKIIPTIIWDCKHKTYDYTNGDTINIVYHGPSGILKYTAQNI